MLVIYQQISTPSQEELAQQQRYRDSIALVEQQQAEILNPTPATNETNTTVSEQPVISNQVSDSLRQLQMAGAYGPFSAAANGTEEESTIENDLIKITFTNKGARIKQVQLKNFSKAIEDEEGKEVKLPLLLLEDEKNKFDYFLPIAT